MDYKVGDIVMFLIQEQVYIREIAEIYSEYSIKVKEIDGLLLKYHPVVSIDWIGEEEHPARRI